ncbi:MAG: fumarate hydratase [Balneolaceae bacterium]
MITTEQVYRTAVELHLQAATKIPNDVKQAMHAMANEEQETLPRYVLEQMKLNYDIAQREKRPMCSDTGLPRFYVKIGNEAQLEGGFVAFERELRRATEYSTHSIPLRPNRVDPLTRKDYNNNVGSHAPTVDYTFEPNVDWIDITTVHKGGLFGSDYRMLFPSDGIQGIKKFYLDVIGEFFRRGMSCQPVTIGIGLGGTKDVCVRLAKEAACLRIVGDSHPDTALADLEFELKELGNSSGFGIMGFKGTQSVMDVHLETAYAHTGGMPIAIHHFCLAQRRCTARLFPDGSIKFRDDPQWFTSYYRRTSVE